MYEILPQYLSSIATKITETKNKKILFNINCICGGQNFFIFKNCETAEEITKKKNWESLIKGYNSGYSDDKGNLYLTKKIFGIKIKQIKINRSDVPQYNTIIKVKCSECGKEYIIYDSRENGYDAMVDSLENNKITDLPVQYIKFLDKEQSIKIKITNDLAYQEFVDEFQNASLQDFSNAFSEISIYITNNNKRKCIFTAETR